MQETISFIIPTGGRQESLLRLSNSIQAATRHLELLEVVLVVDHDDEASVRFQYDGLNIRKVEVAPGLAMGSLNMADDAAPITGPSPMKVLVLACCWS